MRDGILLIDKPAGISSAGVVARVKRALGAARVGHAGTLDPDATGLLIILINGATRVASYAADGYKVYSGEIQLGITTTTDDTGGEIIGRGEVLCSWEDIVKRARELTGWIDQIPPTVSAKKIGGKRAYRLHREGQQVVLSPRRVEVRRFEVEPVPGNQASLRYRVEVSPGTYVRAIARDLGQLLGCGASAVSIRREVSGHFSVQNALTIEEVSWEHLKDWAQLVPDLPSVAVTPEIGRALVQGQRWALPHAWGVIKHDGVEPLPSHVVYRDGGNNRSLGILKTVAGGGFEFCLNIARHTDV
jgi:tRNA pseudouridine55 synthase